MPRHHACCGGAVAGTVGFSYVSATLAVSASAMAPILRASSFSSGKIFTASTTVSAGYRAVSAVTTDALPVRYAANSVSVPVLISTPVSTASVQPSGVWCHWIGFHSITATATGMNASAKQTVDSSVEM